MASATMLILYDFASRETRTRSDNGFHFTGDVADGINYFKVSHNWYGFVNLQIQK